LPGLGNTKENMAFAPRVKGNSNGKKKSEGRKNERQELNGSKYADQRSCCGFEAKNCGDSTMRQIKDKRKSNTKLWWGGSNDNLSKQKHTWVS